MESGWALWVCTMTAGELDRWLALKGKALKPCGYAGEGHLHCGASRVCRDCEALIRLARRDLPGVFEERDQLIAKLERARTAIYGVIDGTPCVSDVTGERLRVIAEETK